MRMPDKFVARINVDKGTVEEIKVPHGFRECYFCGEWVSQDSINKRFYENICPKCDGLIDEEAKIRRDNSARMRSQRHSDITGYRLEAERKNDAVEYSMTREDIINAVSKYPAGTKFIFINDEYLSCVSCLVIDGNKETIDGIDYYEISEAN